MSLKIRLLVLFFGLIFFSMAFIVDWLRFLDEPFNAMENHTLLMVQPGENLHSLSNKMYVGNQLKSKTYLLWYARLMRRGKSIYVGEYLLEKDLTASEFLSKLEKGDVFQRAVTFIEGWTLNEAMSALDKANKLLKDENESSIKTMEALFGDEVSSLEGLLFPDTYFYHFSMRQHEVIERAMTKMHRKLTNVWGHRQENLPLKSPYEALILASIIEKEGSAAHERPMIAGVMVSRLRKGMRLQVDASVIYGLGEAFDGNLTRKDLERDQPYNTYTRYGLPPTPICLPSLSALEAAVQPKELGYFYYVSKGDGTHVFSKTLEEHRRAVRKYQLKQ